jgi:hypothetical protein
MPAYPIEPPYPVFTDTDGTPLENGYIWIGEEGLNPQTNPLNVYWDSNNTIPAAQPLRTTGGYVYYQGSPSKFFTTDNYSISIYNSKGVLVFSSLSFTWFPPNFTSSENATGTGTQTSFTVSAYPNNIYINGVYQNKNTYIVSGTDVVFSEAPPINSVIEFVY